MNIVVSFKKIWGKELFYPVSEDAIFISKMTGRPTLLKNQLKLCMDAGWNVSIIQEKFNLNDYLK